MYSWSPTDIFRLLGISIPSNRKEIKVPCPFCGGKNFGYNTVLGIGKCYQCDNGADSASYYALSMGMSLYDARKDIERRMGIKDDDFPAIRGPRVVCVPESHESARCSDDVLDDTYRAFLRELTLSPKNRNMLINRGLSNAAIDSLLYRTFPLYGETDIFGLCKRLQGIEKKPEGEIINPKENHILKGVPGFFRCKEGKGDYTIAQMTKGIIMPQVNVHNQITGLQVRKDDDLRGRDEPKCGWFSSKDRYDGCGACANVHYACDFFYNVGKHRYDPVIPEENGVKGVLLTEGIMKADIAHFCLPNCPVISVPGVNATKQLSGELKYLRDEYGVNAVALAYDMDYKTNKHVQDALEKTKEIINGLGLKLIQKEWLMTVKVIKDGQEKEVILNGIDDFLVFAKYGIYPEVKKI